MYRYKNKLEYHEKVVVFLQFNLKGEFDILYTTNNMQMNITCLIQIRLFEPTKLALFPVFSEFVVLISWIFQSAKLQQGTTLC